MIIEIPISVGELIDKLTILIIKQEQITDLEKLKNIKQEYELLSSILDTHNIDIEQEQTQLYNINQKLWDIEDQLRQKEKLKQFDQQFVELARLVYYTNDQRAEIKKQINIKLGSTLIEEKSYEQY